MKSKFYAALGAAIVCFFVACSCREVHGQTRSAPQTTIFDKDGIGGEETIATLTGLLAHAEQRAVQIARQASQAPKSKQNSESTRQRVRREVEAAFLARQQLQRAEVQKLREQLARIEKSIAARERIKEKIIERRVDELLDPNVQWEPARSSAGGANSSIARNSTPRRASSFGSNSAKRSGSSASLTPENNLSGGRAANSAATTPGSGLQRATPVTVLDPLDGVVRTAEFTPDGRKIVVGGGRYVTVLEVATGKALMKLTGHSKTVSWLDISPDGSQVATASKDGLVRLYELKSGRLLREFPAEARQSLWSVAWSPDGGKLAGCSNQAAYLWDAATGKLIEQFRVEAPRSFTRVVFGPQGRQLAVAETRGAVTVLDIDGNGKFRQRLEITHEGRQYVSSCAFSLDGASLLTTGYDFTIRQWNAKDGTLQRTMEAEREPQAAVYSRDGKRILSVTQNETIQLWDSASGKELASIKGTDREIRGLALSTDGKSLATFGDDKVVKIWRVTNDSISAGVRRR